MNRNQTFNLKISANDFKNGLSIDDVVLLKIISVLEQKDECTASNADFADFFKLIPTTISRKISKLKKQGYISVSYSRKHQAIVKRTIKLLPKAYYLRETISRTQHHNVKNIYLVQSTDHLLEGAIQNAIVIADSREKALMYFEKELSGNPDCEQRYRPEWFTCQKLDLSSSKISQIWLQYGGDTWRFNEVEYLDLEEGK
ncbi:hypothetical protein RON43_06035 [Lactobacillus gasseri]|uniref:hypothetical protein n=1 Tax=Lactobacillus gasseri TaxID=1596 RepID=UPI0022AC856C|nr:hypothetical protein [Lactobacillus gasseri]MCT7894495.1 hypothetical protein [Lactobacillus gasseri]MCZ3760965.1 hypothetical protein [Lactobacillus gasseri]MCZ3762748.1 hypothetical protein [Lactobacillus gasseri]MCZ3766239.1 hypothetical protein [Lactobacillus gasseri]MCZ3768020.1 hypothetical protein [Lactobacillus gasseri]